MTITLHRLAAIAIQKTRGFGCRGCDLRPSPDESSAKKVAAKLFILQGGAEPLSSVHVLAEPSQLLLGMLELPDSQVPSIPFMGLFVWNSP